MIDVSVTAWKTRPDAYAPLELENTGPVRLAGTALLSDSQTSFLGQFIVAHLPRRQHEAFRRTVLGKLADGRPGGAAFKRALALAAIEHGLTPEQLSAAGLLIITERNDRKIASSRDCDIT